MNESAVELATPELPETVESLGFVTIDGKQFPVSRDDQGNLIAKDENNNVYRLRGPGNKEEVSKERKPSKLELKRFQIYAERARRLINRGVDPKKVDAVIAQEDYEALPLGDKFKRFQQAMNQAMGELGRDMMGLRHNDGVLADAMDANYRSMARCLEKLGITKEQQSEIIKTVNAEIEAELKAKMDEARQQVAARAQQVNQATEAQSVEALTQAEGKQLTPDAPPAEEQTIPEGATEFGG